MEWSTKMMCSSSINNVSVQCPVLPHKRNCSGATGQKLMKELSKLYMKAPVVGKGDTCEINEVEYGRNLDGHLMFILEATTIT
jgi:hypothetical protein